MGLFYEREVTPESGGIRIVELIAMSPVEGVPPRPTPGPTPPDPNAPHPEHPIMLPGMPGWGVPPGGGPGPGGGQAATLRPVPEGATVPPVDATWIDAVVTPAGGQPSWAKIGPYLEHHPA